MNSEFFASLKLCDFALKFPPVYNPFRIVNRRIHVRGSSSFLPWRSIMSQPRRRMSGFVIALVGVSLLGWYSLSQAGGPDYRSTVQAAFQGDKLLVAVDLTSD